MGASRLYTARTPYNAAELPEIDAEQSADVLYMAHIDHVPTKLKRLAHTNWQFSDVVFGPSIVAPTGINAVPHVVNDGDGDLGGDSNTYPLNNSYVVTAINDDTGQESRASTADSASNDLTLSGNYNTISWTGVTGASRYAVYKDDTGSGSYGYIGSATSTSFQDRNIAAALDDQPPGARNPFSGTGNYPSTVTFFEQRLAWGRTRNKINGVWLSQSANFENMDVSRPAKADDAVTFAMVSQQVNAVNQLVPMTDLLVLASDGVFRVNGGDQGYITPANPVIRRQLSRGSSRLNPILIDDVVFHTPSKGASVRSIGYTFEADGYRSSNISIFSPHFFDGHRIVDWAYAQEPQSVIWAARDDGKLLAFTWQQEQQVWGWTLCETDGIVESVTAVSEDGEDRLYLIVRRTVKGAQVRYIERMATSLWEDVNDCCYLDCAVLFGGIPRTTFEGLDHLEGLTVDVLADGSVIKDVVVTGGRIVLPYVADKVAVGLPFTSTVETMPVVASGEGSAQGKRQMLAKAIIRVYKTRGIFAGANEATLYELKDRDSRADVDENPPLLTGDYEVNMAPVTNGAATVTIRQSYPLPMTLTGVFLDPIITA